MGTPDSERIEGLRAVGDYFTNMVGRRQSVGHGDVEEYGPHRRTDPGSQHSV